MISVDLDCAASEPVCISTRSHDTLLTLLQLSDVTRLAHNFIEAYFEVVHHRQPILSPEIFRAQLADGTIPHAIVAVVMLFGAKVRVATGIAIYTMVSTVSFAVCFPPDFSVAQCLPFAIYLRYSSLNMTSF